MLGLSSKDALPEDHFNIAQADVTKVIHIGDD
jgi:hypothetical protein